MGWDTARGGIPQGVGCRKVHGKEFRKADNEGYCEGYRTEYRKGSRMRSWPLLAQDNAQ